MMSLDTGATDAREMVLTNAQLVLADELVSGTIRITGARITGIDHGTTSVPGAVDVGGDFLCPGLIELHTDNLERHLTPRPGVRWPRRNAILAHDAELASAGITTMFDALRVGSIISTGKSRYGKYARDVTDEILALRQADALKISHFIHLRAEICSETLIEELGEFHPEDRIGLLSLMDHSPGQRQFADLDQFRKYLAGKHSMSDGQIDDHFENLRAMKARNGELHEKAGVKRAHELGAILASHDDTLPAHVDRSAETGVQLAEFPTTLAAAKACRERGIAIMMGAPNVVRGGSHSGNVAADELADAGLLDILSSDYVPASLLMGAMHLGDRLGCMAKGVSTVTSAPASAARLTDRGTLAPDLRADLVRFTRIEGAPVVRGVWVQGRKVA